MSEMPTVWILGAGFSRSLGGPLLDDLLSMRGWYEYLSHEQGAAKDSTLQKALALYHFGRNFPEGYLFDTGLAVPKGAQWWSSAEEFLEFLSALGDANNAAMTKWQAVESAFGGPLAHEARAMSFVRGGFNVADSQAATLRFVAWHCRFVERHKGSVDDWERAAPYRDWGKLLDHNDTLITFNYDTVIESLARPSVKVVLPNPEQDQPATESNEAAEGSSAKDEPRLLKLHGSVDWTEQNQVVSRQTSGPLTHPLIATPGDSKYSYRRGMFAPLWNEASQAIKAARRIVWMGYSMPASDASAVELLLSSIGSNPNDGLEIDIVLGNGAADAHRIAAMLDGVLAARPIPSLLVQLSEAQRYLTELRSKEPELRKLRKAQIAIQGGNSFAYAIPNGPASALRRLELQIDQAFVGFHGHTLPRRIQSPNHTVGVGHLYAQDYLRRFSVRHDRSAERREAEEAIAAVVSQLEAFKAEVLK